MPRPFFAPIRWWQIWRRPPSKRCDLCGVLLAANRHHPNPQCGLITISD
jgi:hypothetical protein